MYSCYIPKQASIYEIIFELSQYAYIFCAPEIR